MDKEKEPRNGEGGNYTRSIKLPLRWIHIILGLINLGLLLNIAIDFLRG